MRRKSYYKCCAIVKEGKEWNEYKLCFTDNKEKCQKEYLKQGFLPGQLIFYKMG